jgi:hypothetical protein
MAGRVVTRCRWIREFIHACQARMWFETSDDEFLAAMCWLEDEAHRHIRTGWAVPRVTV